MIDDEMEIRGFLQDFFEEKEYQVEAARDGLEGWEKFQAGQYDLVVCDMMMPRMIGLDVLKNIMTVKPDQRVIMLTGVKETSLVEKAKALGCKFYLNKPFGLQDLDMKVKECIQA